MNSSGYVESINSLTMGSNLNSLTMGSNLNSLTMGSNLNSLTIVSLKMPENPTTQPNTPKSPIEFFTLNAEQNSIKLGINGDGFSVLFKAMLEAKACDSINSGAQSVYCIGMNKFNMLICKQTTRIAHVFEYDLLGGVVHQVGSLVLSSTDIKEIMEKGWAESTYGKFNSLLNTLYTKYKNTAATCQDQPDNKPPMTSVDKKPEIPTNDENLKPENQRTQQVVSYDPNKMYLGEFEKQITETHIKCNIPEIYRKIFNEFATQYLLLDNRCMYQAFKTSNSIIESVKFYGTDRTSCLVESSNSSNKLILCIGIGSIFTTEENFEWKTKYTSEKIKAIKDALGQLSRWAEGKKEHFNKREQEEKEKRIKTEQEEKEKRDKQEKQKIEEEREQKEKEDEFIQLITSGKLTELK